MELHARIRRLIKTRNHSLSEIARIVGCSRGIVSRVYNSKPDKGPTAEWVCQFVRQEHYIEKAVAMVRDGCEIHWACEQVGESVASVRGRCHRRGIKINSDLSRRSIYALACPITIEVRYIGAAVEPKRRGIQHLTKPHSKKLRQWVRSLSRVGKAPLMYVIEECCGNEWGDAERKWIRFCLDRGYDLLNDRETKCRNS